MNILRGAITWFGQAANWSGPDGIPTRVGEHLGITLLAVGIAAVIALPIGVAVGHARRGELAISLITGAARAVPTLGLLTIVGLWLGIGLSAPMVALVVLAIPSLLAGAASGVRSVDPHVVDAARAQGFTPLQVITKVELPLAAPVIVGGLRVAVLQTVATATLAAYVSDYGLGRYIFRGLGSQDYSLMLAGSLLVTTMALVFDLLLNALQRSAERRAHPGRVRERDLVPA